MSTDIVPFTYGNHTTRVVVIDGEPWWVALDVCQVLDIVNTSQAVARLDADCVSQTYITDAVGRERPTAIINEAGLYELILRSDKPEAKPFRKWVTGEVLPQIRKTGSYVPTPKTLQQALRDYADALDEAEKAKAQVKELAPRAERHDEAMDADGGYYVGTVARIMGFDKRSLVFRDILAEIGFIDGPRGNRFPGKEAMDAGHVVARGVAGQTTVITPEGLSFLKGLPWGQA
jgi:anti-repressor protein